MMSMSKYNIRLNVPKPSEEEIREFKNFNRVLHQYKRAKRPRPLHSIMGKMNRLIPIIIIILSLLLFLMYYLQFMQQHKKEQQIPEPKEQVYMVPASQEIHNISYFK
jgi:hypothetical protein